ncbi:ABC transporter substrate-binding protein [Bradyrhizobium sp. cf659]|uniref:ABC transporter substrate-binding protein n=1 Tax=Bradyrhizobium sp. cf659 TaxID=1761771 RepID=UPI0008F16671|nr:ABC transporter substrate-binding protein [Bradyrhizobium sp. cf659]SFI04792.1 peptide/nickel transport system substrate-binding protein [Bradyrhizobium sp. cf659]
MNRLVVALCLMLVSLSTTRAESVLRSMVTTDIRGLMPGNSPDDNTGLVLQQIYEGLVAWRGDGTVAPMLAKAIETSADGRTYTFTLREGVTFHNGAPLTSREVVWTWDRFLDPKSAWPCRANFDGTRKIRIVEVAAPSPEQVVFRLAEPSGALLSTMARADCDGTGIAHPDSVGVDGAWQKAIGTGPFKLAEWRRGQFIELTRNEAYAARGEPADGLAGAKLAKVDRVRLSVVPDPAAAKAAIQSGNLDLWPSMDPKFAGELKSAGLAIASSSVASLNAIVMQTNDPLLKDKRIRGAIAAALDYPSMSESLTDGYAKPSTSLVPLSSRYYGAVEQAGNGLDIARARKLLTEAGYKGEPIRITTNSRFPVMNDVAVLAQAMAQQAGLNLSVEVVEFATQLSRYNKGDYQLMVWNYTPYLDPAFGLDRFVGDKAAQPDKVWGNRDAIELLAKLMETAAPEARQPLFDALHKLFVDDAPMIVWSSGVNVSAVSPAVRGYAPWAGRKPRFWNVEVVR